MFVAQLKLECALDANFIRFNPILLPRNSVKLDCKSKPRSDYPGSFRIVVFYARDAVGRDQLLEIPQFLQEEFLPRHPADEDFPWYGLIDPGVLYLSGGVGVENVVSLVELCAAADQRVDTANTAEIQRTVTREILENNNVYHTFLVEGEELVEIDEQRLAAVCADYAGIDVLIVEFEENYEEEMY